MATTSNRTALLTYTGDVSATEVLVAAANLASPGSFQLLTLTSGANTITVPTGGSTVTAVTIVPPTGNVVTITLKGVTGDTGIALNLTDPTTIALASGVVNFVLTVGAAGITGLKLYWS